MGRGRPKKTVVITSAPFDAEKTINGGSGEPKAIKIKENDGLNYTDDLDQFMESSITYYNYMMHEFRNIFPEPCDQVVTRFYPHAKCGAVYVDIPQTDRQIEICKKKQAIMKQVGKQYVVYKPKDVLSLEAIENELTVGI